MSCDINITHSCVVFMHTNTVTSYSGPDIPYPSVSNSMVLLNYSQPVSISCSVQWGAVQGLGCGGQVISSGMSIVWTIEVRHVQIMLQAE